MNIEQARFNMVEQQIRPWEVLDTTVLDLLYEVRREDFVPEAWRGLAFVDMEIPLGLGETMLSPKMEARLIQELHIKKSDRVLEVGTGSGYMAALLSRLAAAVTTVEIHPELAAGAARNLKARGYDNVLVEVGDAARGWRSGEQWDVIVLTGSVPVMPQSFLDAVAPGGCLLAIVGDAPAMEAIHWKQDSSGVLRSETLFETVIPPLHHALQPVRFQF
ncbi:MAG: protein-L-isoaspartate O-methyltransferase [Betaproteobacteria bacterium]|nr:protein-L-isoaspartate O-methyltransferase [Betaproteobacteria bacterium]